MSWKAMQMSSTSKFLNFMSILHGLENKIKTSCFLNRGRVEDVAQW